MLKADGRLLTLISEVLEFERIEAGRMMFSPEPVALAETVREAIALIAPLARDVTLHSNTDGLARNGHVHADRLKQVLLNLLSSAIKYKPPRWASRHLVCDHRQRTAPLNDRRYGHWYRP